MTQALLLLAVAAALFLSACAQGQSDGGGPLPPAPVVAAPLHPWCPECSSLPVASLGTTPRVRRKP